MSRTLACLFACLLVLGSLVAAAGADEPIDIGSRRELFVDEFLIAKLTGARQVLHAPTPRELAIVHDAPWEGNTCAYHTVFQDGTRYRMYYRASSFNPKTRKRNHPEFTCYAESADGVTWTRPKLGLFDFEGSKANNIVWVGEGTHDFAPCKDTNPACRPEAKYKAIGRGASRKGLFAFQSPDGLHWKLMQAEPIITEGAFDSQNLAFWDSVRGRYVEFHRGFRRGRRDIMTCTSKDFVHWTKPVWLDYGNAPPEHLYTNQITAYFRAPHIFLGFPKRFVPTRKGLRYGRAGVSDGVFMASRDGLHFRRWAEAFIRPGLQIERWVNRNNLTAWGIVVTKPFLPGVPDELSVYSTEHYYQGTACKLRRFSLRMDGFVSIQAPMAGGELLTKPIRFAGKHLTLNVSTSGAGSVRVEIQDPAGKPVPGFALDQCPEIYGDSLDRVVAWKAGTDVSALAGKAIRLRFLLKDADLYSLRFR